MGDAPNNCCKWVNINHPISESVFKEKSLWLKWRVAAGWVMDLAAGFYIQFSLPNTWNGFRPAWLVLSYPVDTLRREWLQQCVSGVCQWQRNSTLGWMQTYSLRVPTRWPSVVFTRETQEPCLLPTLLRAISIIIGLHPSFWGLEVPPFCTPEFSISISDSWLNFHVCCMGCLPNKQLERYFCNSWKPFELIHGVHGNNINFI